MSSLTNRRAFMAVAGGGSLAGIAGSALASGSFPNFATLPSAALTRTVTRALGGGGTLSVQRQWELQFVPISGGAIAQGTLKDVEVHAPASLGALARIERDRRGDGPFPLHLDQYGRIVGASSDIANDTMSAAIAKADLLIDAARLPASDAGLARQFMATLQRGGAELLSKLPGDLLFPRQLHWESHRNLELPDGQRGQFSVDFTATLLGTSPLLASAERRIVTRIGSDERVSSELWQLSPHTNHPG